MLLPDDDDDKVLHALDVPVVEDDYVSRLCEEEERVLADILLRRKDQKTLNVTEIHSTWTKNFADFFQLQGPWRGKKDWVRPPPSTQIIVNSKLWREEMATLKRKSKEGKRFFSFCFDTFPFLFLSC